MRLLADASALLALFLADDRNHRAEAARALLASRRYQILFLDLEVVKRLSLTDCASFVLMTRLGIDAAFAFDSDFRDCGFAMVPPQPPSA